MSLSQLFNVKWAKDSAYIVILKIVLDNPEVHNT